MSLGDRVYIWATKPTGPGWGLLIVCIACVSFGATSQFLVWLFGER